MITFPKHLPTALGSERLWITPRAYRRYWTHSLEAIHGDVLAAVARWVRSGDTVWDVGANVGVFAVAAAAAAGPTGGVVAFEADVDMAALLVRSVAERRGRGAEVVVIPAAVSDHSGSVRFAISGYRTAASSIEGFGRFQDPGRVRVCPCWKIDDLMSWHGTPTVVKIDVEGAENLVLRGATGAVRSGRPVILCECSGGETGEESARLFRDWDYVWRPWLSDEPFGNQAVPNGDIVAVPAESADAMRL
jgi:FkbM family methyltransferase